MNKPMTTTDTAAAFFDAIETGKGWAACAPYCTPGATFSCQSDALAEIGTIEAYTGWMEGLLKLAPDGRYDMKAFAADEARSTVMGFAVFHGTHTAEGGPVPPTGRSVAADYVYAMEFDGPKIKHMTKIWNDAQSISPRAQSAPMRRIRWSGTAGSRTTRSWSTAPGPRAAGTGPTRS
jgi:hypothetical protein